MVSKAVNTNSQRKTKTINHSSSKVRKVTKTNISKALLKKSLNDTLVVKDGFNIRTSLTPCSFKEQGCTYINTSLKSTRQALQRHELRCPVLKELDYEKWFDNCRYTCVCGRHYDISY